MTINDLFDVTLSVDDHVACIIHDLVLKNIKAETVDEITDDERQKLEDLSYAFDEEYTHTARLVAYALRQTIGAD